MFGKVIDEESKKVVKSLEAVGSPSGTVKYGKKPTIVDSGEN